MTFLTSKVKVTIAQEENIPNIWNDTMFGDLDWPLNASHGFVSISWASCFCMWAKNNSKSYGWISIKFSGLIDR